MSSRSLLQLLVALLVFAPVFFLPSLVLAQEEQTQPQTAVSQDDYVYLFGAERTQFEQEGLNLEALVKLLQVEQQMQIYYDATKFPVESRVKFFGEAKIRKGQPFFQFVQLILRNNRFAIVESDVKGNHQIVPLANVRPFAPRRTAEAGTDISKGLESGQYMTAVFELKHISLAEAEAYLNQFIIRPVGQNSQSTNNVDDNVILQLTPNLLIVTELASRIKRISDAIELIDIPQAKVQTKFVKINHLEAKSLETQIKTILEQLDTVQGRLGTESANPPTPSGATNLLQNIRLSSDERTNRLILIGTEVAIERVMTLIEELDQQLELKTKTYNFQWIPPSRIDALIKRSLPKDEEQRDRFYQATINDNTKTLVVSARDDILAQVDELKEQFDKEGFDFAKTSPVKFYKLKHVQAADILDTLQRVSRQTRPDLFRDGQGNGRFDNQGVNRLGTSLPTGNRNRDGSQTLSPGFNDRNQEGPIPSSEDGQFNSLPLVARDPLNSTLEGLLLNPFLEQENVLPGEAQITVDENTNTLIVVAEPEIQELYQELIEKLDVYRPQVLVEVTVVTLDAQEDFNLGIEVSAGDRRGDERLFSFTSFGLSEVDAATGGLSLTPGLGFNGTLVDPNVADVVLRALSRHRRARVVSAPRILVNDNATGLLSSVAEVPFSSINASNTVATTSFAGFATAGTTVSVTPHISEGDYLNLEFDVLVNDFTGAGNDTLPPPRNTDQVTSEVSIPDGYTVIVGGLTRQRSSTDEQAVPFLEEVPVFKLLTRNLSDGDREQRLFVFIKPIILKDDKFKDLRFVSEIAHRKSKISPDFPTSEPLLIR